MAKKNDKEEIKIDYRNKAYALQKNKVKGYDLVEVTYDPENLLGGDAKVLKTYDNMLEASDAFRIKVARTGFFERSAVQKG